MDSLTIFGLFAVSAMLVFYALEERNTFYILCFAGACALGSIYGFLQGTWPFGIVETIWAAIAQCSLVFQRNSLPEAPASGAGSPDNSGLPAR